MRAAEFADRAINHNAYGNAGADDYRSLVAKDAESLNVVEFAPQLCVDQKLSIGVSRNVHGPISRT